MSAPGPATDDQRSLSTQERTATREARPSCPGSAGPGPREPAIDLAHLHGFTDGDPQLEDELSALFLSSAEVYLQRLGEALSDAESWRRTAHALKGASANLGARRMATLALRAERSAPSAMQLQEIGSALDEVRRFFENR